MLKSAVLFKCEDIVEKYKNYLDAIKITMECKKIYEFFQQFNFKYSLVGKCCF